MCLIQNLEVGYFKFTLPFNVAKVTSQLMIELGNAKGKKNLLCAMKRFNWDSVHYENVAIGSIWLEVWDRFFFLA